MSSCHGAIFDECLCMSSLLMKSIFGDSDDPTRTGSILVVVAVFGSFVFGPRIGPVLLHLLKYSYIALTDNGFSSSSTEELLLYLIMTLFAEVCVTLLEDVCVALLVDFSGPPAVDSSFEKCRMRRLYGKCRSARSERAVIMSLFLSRILPPI